MDEAVNFYLSIGLTMKQRWDDHYAMLSGPGITIGLHPSEGEVLSSGSLSIGFMTDDLADARTLLDKNGISYKEEDGTSGTYIHFHDPYGTILYYVLPKW